jgi:uncharacterized RDD family membrane protein YckC
MSDDLPVSEAPAAAKPAGFIRRTAATFMDVFAGLLGSFLVLSLLGLFIPMDSSRMASLTRPAMIIGLLYVGIGPYLLSNSLGKYALAVQVISDRTGQKPRLWQFLTRWAMLILWPVEVLMLVFAPSKKRIGDRLAATTVVENAKAKARWGRRFGLSLTALFILYLALVQAMQAAAKNTEMFTAADAFLQEYQVGVEALGAPVSTSATPFSIVMKQEKGTLIVSAEGPKAKGYIEITLSKGSGRWEVVDSQVTEEPSGRGYSYSY